MIRISHSSPPLYHNADKTRIVYLHRGYGHFQFIILKPLCSCLFISKSIGIASTGLDRLQSLTYQERQHQEKKNMSDAKNCYRMDNSKNLHLIFSHLLHYSKLTATLITLAVLLSGCSKSIYGLIKSDTKNQTSTPQSTLIKPKLDDPSPVSDDSQQKTSDSVAKITEVQPKDSDRNPENPRSPNDSAKIVPEPLPKPPSEEIPKPPKRLTGIEQGQFPEEKDQKPGDKPPLPLKNTKDSDEDEMLGLEEERNPSFKKHDHTKYLTTIKNRAIDVVNKEPDSVYARMCRHNTSEEWSLSLYFVQAKNYYFRIYVWDPIENIWAETFESEKRPVTGYKKHLSFSLAGKKCISLKGSDRE